MAKIINGKKCYPVSERILFGLESMYEKAQYMMECEKLKDEQYEEWSKLADECSELQSVAGRTGFLPGKEYGRAKEITGKREWMRYNACIAAGMSERDAGWCFK